MFYTRRIFSNPRSIVWSISYPESSGFLVSGATPGRLWGHRKNSIFLIGCSVTVSIVLPQKSCGNKIRCPQSLPGVAPLTKKPEDSGYEIVVWLFNSPQHRKNCCSYKIGAKTGCALQLIYSPRKSYFA